MKNLCDTLKIKTLPCFEKAFQTAMAEYVRPFHTPCRFTRGYLSSKSD